MFELALSLCRVRLICHRRQNCEELIRLACEEVHVGQEGGCGSCASEFVGEGADDGAVRKVRAKEFARNREDKVGLEEWTVLEEVREFEALIRYWRYGRLYGVAGEVDPFEEVRDLVGSDAESDFENLLAGYFARQTGVEA